VAKKPTQKVTVKALTTPSTEVSEQIRNSSSEVKNKTKEHTWIGDTEYVGGKAWNGTKWAG
jgi:hypothetical protein